MTEAGVRAAIDDYARRVTECSAQLTDCDYTILEERLTGRVLEFEKLNHNTFATAGRWLELGFGVREVSIDDETQTATAAICEYAQLLDDPNEVRTVLSRNSLVLRYESGRWLISEDDVWPNYEVGDPETPTDCDE